MKKYTCSKMENEKCNSSDSHLTDDLNSFNMEVDSGLGLCFLTKIENDIQSIFDDLQNYYPYGDTELISRNLLKKGSIFQRGDFFLSLRSNRVFFNPGVKEKLLDKLKVIPYISESSIDDNGNLILCLNRAALFKIILNDVMKYEKKYGIKTSEASFLILVHNEVFNDFDALRIALVANHVISFLTATGAKVCVNEYRKSSNMLFKEVPQYTCSEFCLQEIHLTGKLIKNTVKDCGLDGNKMISFSETDKINVALKKYAIISSQICSKDIDDISIDKQKPNNVINQAAYTLHFKGYHEVTTDHIIYICLQNDKRKIIESGLLIEMLNLISVPQSFIACQNTHSKTESGVTVDEYINYQKRGIENAMKDKYSHDILKDDKWAIYFKNLVDTTMKFNFLKAGISDPLKVDLNFNQQAILKHKDGVFIQYNFARISNILKKFDLKVEEGCYKKLPVINEIDFSLLRFEEEWNLLNFVLGYPRLIEEIFLSLCSKNFFPVNKIQIMLVELCHCFSKYYGRIHILGGSQLQIQKVMHARLWLLRGVYQILYNSFYLLNIEGLSEM